MTKKAKSLLDYAGILTKEEADHLEKTIAESRKRSRKRMNKNKLLI